jgi:serine/threonine protein kinase
VAEPLPGPRPQPEADAEVQRLRAAAALLASTQMAPTEPGDGGSDPFEGLGPLATPSREGEHIGPYRIERELGRGGHGHGVRRDPRRRRVRADRSRSSCCAPIGSRPRRRRASSANARSWRRLQHPNIARLLDGGVTAQGEAWFALELVSGMALIRLCERARHRSARAPSACFLATCEAVGYAHTATSWCTAT